MLKVGGGVVDERMAKMSLSEQLHEVTDAALSPHHTTPARSCGRAVQQEERLLIVACTR